MTELEKLDAGPEYCFFDADVVARKENALKGCEKFNAINPADYAAQLAAMKELFGSTGEDFLTNYNVTILDIAPVHIGDYCMLITTVGHPLTPRGRREKKAYSKPVTIGNDV